MEFVGNKKTACFCGTPNCSGLIGEKPKDEKRQQQLQKKKGKKRRPQSSIMKITLQQPAKKRRRTFEGVKDPIQIMLEQMPEKETELDPEMIKEEQEPVPAITTSNEIE